MEQLQWVNVPGYEGLYEISGNGVLRNVRTQRCLCADRNNCVGLYDRNHKHKGWALHVLLAGAFLNLDIHDPYHNRVLFKDGNKQNCVISNIYVEDTSDLPGEEWAPVNYAAGRPVQNFYRVSNKGRVKSAKHVTQWVNYGRVSSKCVPEMILDQVVDYEGRCTVWLSAVNKPDIVAQVHRLVASAFCDNDDPVAKTEVNHIDCNPSNNASSNLEWCTRSENMQHAYKHDLVSAHARLRYPVKRLETGEMFNSMTDAERAMGRCSGYIQECMSRKGTCRDRSGNIWTLEIYKDKYIKVHQPTRRCWFVGEPDKVFVNMAQASEYIGRWEGYVYECLQFGRPIKARSGEILEIQFEESPCIVVGEN